jgi:hypothetical protein
MYRVNYHNKTVQKLVSRSESPKFSQGPWTFEDYYDYFTQSGNVALELYEAFEFLYHMRLVEVFGKTNTRAQFGIGIPQSSQEKVTQRLDCYASRVAWPTAKKYTP